MKLRKMPDGQLVNPGQVVGLEAGGPGKDRPATHTLIRTTCGPMWIYASLKDVAAALERSDDAESVARRG